MSVIEERVVIAMVGLPARGKSYTSKAIVKYLNFFGCPVRLFNAGDKRRVAGLAGTAASFFDASNHGAARQREQIAMGTLDELLAWLEAAPRGCACGIFDATNTTVARRRAVIERCALAGRAMRTPLRLVFVENVCDDEAILHHSYAMKLSNADYQGADPASAYSDFVARCHRGDSTPEHSVWVTTASGATPSVWVTTACGLPTAPDMACGQGGVVTDRRDSASGLQHRSALTLPAVLGRH
mmetsp:Transcript_6684/g.17486  ORF Transcript_6684/g.17486 Transcript_6684/m.17486 type:complete len:241 (-) Transcript_6684:1158-1880(-)